MTLNTCPYHLEALDQYGNCDSCAREDFEAQDAAEREAEDQAEHADCYEGPAPEATAQTAKKCERCHDVWATCKGPGQRVGPIPGETIYLCDYCAETATDPVGPFEDLDECQACIGEGGLCEDHLDAAVHAEEMRREGR